MPNKNEPSEREAGQPRPLSPAAREQMLAKRNSEKARRLAEWFTEGIRHGVELERREWLISIASKHVSVVLVSKQGSMVLSGRPAKEQAELLRLTPDAEWLPPTPTCVLPTPRRLQ